MNRCAGKSFKSVFEEFVISKTAQGVSESTLNNYKYHILCHFLFVFVWKMCYYAHGTLINEVLILSVLGKGIHYA